jgi:prophage regulatory protein
MNDVLDRLMLDPGSRTFGELVQKRAWAAQEIRRLRADLERLRDLAARNRGVSAQRPAPVTPDPNFNNNPIRLVRAKELKQIVGFGHTTIWRMTKEGRFPQPVRFGRNTFWRLADVIAWQEALRG